MFPQKTVEVAQVQHIGKVVDVPIVMQRQVPTIQTVQKTEVPQVQFDRVVDVPVVLQRQGPTIHGYRNLWTFCMCSFFWRGHGDGLRARESPADLSSAPRTCPHFDFQLH